MRVASKTMSPGQDSIQASVQALTSVSKGTKCPNQYLVKLKDDNIVRKREAGLQRGLAEEKLPTEVCSKV